MKRILPFALAAVAILGLGIALVPSGLEQAFMFLRDKDFSRATQNFERRWSSGDHSREVANALAELLVRKGEPAAAADILRVYVAEHPDDRSALARLAEIFRDDQQRNAYISTLEALWKKDGNLDVLRGLVSLYDIADREADEVTALQILVRSRAAQPEDFLALAKLLSSRQPIKALETLVEAFRRWPMSMDADTAQTFAALATGEDRLDLIPSAIFPWLALQKSVLSIEPVASSLSNAGQDALALQGVLGSGAILSGDPMTLVLAARLEARIGQWKQAFERLQRLQAAQRLPTIARDVFVQAALRAGSNDVAMRFIIDQGADKFPYWLQSWIVAFALERGDTNFLKGLQSGAKTSSGKSLNFFRARVELALGNHQEALDLARLAEQEATSASPGIAIAALYVDLNGMPKARALLAKFAEDPSTLPSDDLMSATEVALAVRDANLSTQLSDRLQKLRRDEPAEILHARALGLNGKSREALELLDQIDRWSEGKEHATFEILLESGQSERLQSLLFERLAAGDTTMGQRTIYAYMLNDFKALIAKSSTDAIEQLAADLDDEAVEGTARLSRIELLGKLDANEALPFARSAAEADPSHASYILLNLYKQLNLTQDAIDFITDAIPKLEAGTQQSLLFEWIALGVTRPALPYLKALASGTDRQWFFAYDEALQKLGERKARVDFLAQFARRPDLDTKFKGELASEILEAGAKQPAVELFMELAAAEPPKSQAIEQLFYLWGPRPPEDAMKWIMDRARLSSTQDHMGWLNRLAEVDAHEEIVSLASLWYAAGERNVAPALATAFAALKMKPQLQNLVASELKSGLSDAQAAVQIAQAAEELDDAHDASLLYEHAANADSKWFAPAGRNAWYAGEQKRARSLLEIALKGIQIDAETSFISAEVMRATHDERNAQRLYLQALALARQASGSNSRRIEMLCLARLGRFDEAEKLARLSAEPSLRQDLASALLDAGHVSGASQVLAVHGQR